jgi:hypothetical protein
MPCRMMTRGIAMGAGWRVWEGSASALDGCSIVCTRQMDTLCLGAAQVVGMPPAAAAVRDGVVVANVMTEDA